MKRLFLFFFLFQTINFIAQNNKSIGFIENKGQIVDQNLKENKKVKYLLNTPGLNVQIREKGFSYDIYETKKVPLTKKDKEFYEINRDSNTESNNFPEHSLEYNFHRIDIDFVNANQDSKIIAEEKSSDYDNYYNVIHAPEGITEVHKFQKVIYQNIYNNIDVVFFIPKDSTKVVEYNFIVRPGGKISDIKLKFNGVKTALIDNKIRMKVKFGEMEETIPLSWIENKNEKEEIKITYKEISKNTFSFNSNIDANNKTIVIDPTPIRLWGTYYGDQTNNHYILGEANIATDIDGNSYMSGSTSASNSAYATAGAHQTSIPQGLYLSTNGIIVKFNPNGQRLWGTYYGGQKYNSISDIKTDSEKNIIICGVTHADTNISTLGAHKLNLTGTNDAFLVKFNEFGLRIWGTYFGGENLDSATALAIDNFNDIYITGFTYSFTGIAFNCNFQQQLFDGPQYDIDAFVSKFDSNGNLIWGTYAGGENIDRFNAIAVKNNYLVVAGKSLSYNNISTPSVFQENHDPNHFFDGIIYKFSTNGSRIWSTYYGGEHEDDIISIEIDDEDFIYFGGKTSSSNNIATPNSFESSNQSGYAGYFAKINNFGSRIWGTFLGDAEVNSIIFKSNSIYIAGTHGSFFNTSHWTNSCSYRPNGFFEGYIGKFSKFGELLWGTFVGGNSTGQKTSITLDQNNNIFVCGITANSNNGVTDANSYQQNIIGIPHNYFIMKFDELNSLTIANSNSPVCINSTIQLTASGGNNYLWSGPNGFTSTEQNPTIPNATALNSGQYSCEITGTGGCDNTVTVNVVVGDNLAPIPDTQNLPNINGDCNTVISTFPTATDNCSGSITATTTDPLSYSTSGNHIITWIYDDGNGNTATQTQNIIISSVADPTMNSSQEFCFQDNATLNDIAIIGQNITWYDAQTNGNILPNTTALVDGTNYYATQTINGCESNRIPVSTTIHNTPVPTTTQNTQSFCSTENATLNSISINGSNILWYDSINSAIPLNNTTLLTDGTTYYTSQTLNNCESINRLAITIQLINTLNANNYSEIICDDLNNGTENVNLSDYESNLLNSTGNIYSYYHTLNGAENQISSDLINNYSNYDLGLGNNTFYVRIESPNTCYQIVELTLTLIEKPKANITDIMPICEGSSITISANNGYDSYLWSTGETTSSISVSQPGNYNVVINQNHGSTTCSSTYTFTVVNSNVATINSIQSEDWTENENYIQINVSGAGDYEYSINGIDYQESNLFSNLPSGEYSIYVRDKNGCGIVSEDIYLLMYPKFFTPNGDGFNDTWKIKFSKNEPNLTIKIFDRYGKFLKQVSPLSEGWDGTYLGQPLPSNDYWFVIIRENGKEYKGHFTLKR